MNMSIAVIPRRLAIFIISKPMRTRPFRTNRVEVGEVGCKYRSKRHPNRKTSSWIQSLYIQPER